MAKKTTDTSITQSDENAPTVSPGKRAMQEVPDDLWVKCQSCSKMLYRKELEQDYRVCRTCGYHFRLTSFERITLTVDEGSFTERDSAIVTADPLGFPQYARDIERYQVQTNRQDSFVWGNARIGECKVVLGASEMNFLSGTMGSVMGEKVVRAAEEAITTRHPLVLLCSGGGARLHEGIVSLMQMAKTSAAIERLSRAGIPYIAVFADPMLAGIAASFAFLADVIIAEPSAIIGFAGPRVVENAYRIKLPPGSMTAEFHQSHGMVDMVLPRKEVRPMLVRMLHILK